MGSDSANITIIAVGMCMFTRTYTILHNARASNNQYTCYTYFLLLYDNFHGFAIENSDYKVQKSSLVVWHQPV